MITFFFSNSEISCSASDRYDVGPQVEVWGRECVVSSLDLICGLSMNPNGEASLDPVINVSSFDRSIATSILHQSPHTFHLSM